MATTYTNLLQPNKNAINPLSPQQSALSSKIQTAIPNWQNTLSQVMSAPSWKPAQLSGNSSAGPTYGGVSGQSKVPVKKTITTDASGNKTETHYDNSATIATKPSTSGTIAPSTASSTDNAKGLVTQPKAPELPSYGGLVGQLATTAQGNRAIGQSAADLARATGQQISDIGQRAAGAGAGYKTTGTTPVAEGNAAVIAQTAAAQQQAAAQGLQAQLQGTAQQLTGQQQMQTGLGTAAGLAAPVQLPYSNQYINPLTGQPVGGGTTGGSLQTAVNDVVTKLQSGQMTYNDAVNALSGYGQGGMNALQQALPSGFNVAQSNTLAGQQGSIKPAYDYANEAMTNLENTLGQLGMLQSTNIPAVNQGANWFSQTFGVNSDSTRAYKAAAAEARGAIQKLLASTQGGTPTDYVSQSAALLPDEPTPNDIAAAKQTLKALGEAKLGVYGTPGMTGTSTGFAETW